MDISEANINIPLHKPRILVAPLDWGLGHATRCIPVVRELIRLGAEPIIAGSGATAGILQTEFPDLMVLDLKGYEVRYSSNPKWFKIKLLQQMPRLCIRLHSEHNWLKKLILKHRIDGIISDNRYGLYSREIPAVLISHQLQIETGNKILNRLVRRVNLALINRFSACWVPDMPGSANLAGLLSHPVTKPRIQVSYIGPLSRFQKLTVAPSDQILLLLSGPEPQRTILEEKMTGWLEVNKLKAVIVRGRPNCVDTLPLSGPFIQQHNHLPATELNTLIAGSRYIIARCGYSTVMDLAVMGKNAILIPTPGQTEQEYLLKHLQQMQLFHCLSQESFLQTDWPSMKKYFDTGNQIIWESHLESVISQWLHTLKHQIPAVS